MRVRGLEGLREGKGWVRVRGLGLEVRVGVRGGSWIGGVCVLHVRYIFDFLPSPLPQCIIEKRGGEC